MKVTSHSHLGMTFTENLSWEVHMHNRIKKTAPTMNVLVRTSRILPRPVKEVIYRTFIRPVLEYGCMVYDNCQAFISPTLEQCQRTAALACTGAYRDTSLSKLLSELGWPTLVKRREYYKLCQLIKLVHTMSPTYMTDSFMVQRADHNHNYDLRNEGDLRIPYPFQSQTVLAYQPHSVLNVSNFVESETSNAFDLRSPEDLFTDPPDDLL